MKIHTRKFGEIEIDDSKILTMPEGLPGFPGFDRFALLEDPKSVPFCWYQSIDTPDLSLVVMNPFLFMPDYHLDLEPVIAAREWGDIAPEKLMIYVVINISEQEQKKSITANMMGPLVINPEAREAIQVALCDSDYSHQHDVLKSLSHKVSG